MVSFFAVVVTVSFFTVAVVVLFAVVPVVSARIAPAPVRAITPPGIVVTAAVIPTTVAVQFVYLVPYLTRYVANAVHDLFDYAYGSVEEFVDYPTHSGGSMHRNSSCQM